MDDFKESFGRFCYFLWHMLLILVAGFMLGMLFGALNDFANGRYKPIDNESFAKMLSDTCQGAQIEQLFARDLNRTHLSVKEAGRIISNCNDKNNSHRALLNQ